MIPERTNLPCYEMRPPIEKWSGTWTLLMMRINLPWLPKLGRAERLKRTLCAAKQCHTREELERLLGPPQYALNPSNYAITTPDGLPRRPEHVEIYHSAGCVYDVLFFPNADSLEVYGWDPFEPEVIRAS